MRQFKFGIPIIGALTIASGLFGCADENHWGSSSNEKGSISLTLSTDSGIKTAKPVFRSDEGESTPDLHTYITVPKPEDFSIKLEKADGTYSKTWSKLEGFLKEGQFSTGAYTLTAFYGEKGKQGFNEPYFEASSTFNVLAGQEYEVNLVAELINSMVKINYSDKFKDYMSDFHASLHTEGIANEIIFGKNETDPAFVEPNNATLNVHITTKDKNYSTSLEVGKFAPFAKTLHNINLDIVDNDNGKEVLEVKFSDDLEDEIVNIDLSDELFTTEAPAISCKGFTDGETIEVLEKTACPSSIEMIADIPGLLGSAILTVESTEQPQWGSEIDLCMATSDQIAKIKAAGIEPVGFGLDRPESTTYEIAMLNLTNYATSLPTGTHKISLKVTDKLGRTSNTSSVTFDSKPVELEVIGTPTIGYCSKNTSVTIDYNGSNPLTELTFKTTDNNTEISATSQEVANSRSLEKKQYIIGLQLPESVTTAREKISVDIYHKGVKKGNCKINVDVPQYDLEYDAFSNHAYIKVNIANNEDPELLNAVISNLQLKLNSEEISPDVVKFQEEIYLLVKDLNPNTKYSVSSSITKGDSYNNHDTKLATESAEKIYNGDFSKEEKEKFEKILDEGGKYKVKVAFFTNDYQLKSSFSYSLPEGWATINDKTAWSKASNLNTWFVVPSSWLENGKGVMRTVGYHHNGTTPATSGGDGNKNYYCENKPESLEVAAGELFLGTYSFDGSETRSEGVKFESRPSSISFNYDYEPLSGNDDKGYAYIELLDEGGYSFGKQTFELERGNNKSKSLAFEYIPFCGKSAATLKVCFKSSKLNNPPIHIPEGEELKESSITALNFTNPPAIPANEYRAVATGSVLNVYNVVAHYGDEETPANAPKRTTKKKR